MTRAAAGIQRGQLRQAQALLREAGVQLHRHQQHCLTCRQVSQGAEIICPAAAGIEIDIKKVSRLIRDIRNPETPGQGILF